MKINIVKVASLAGTLLSLAGMLVSGWAGQKATDEEIAKGIAEAFAKQVKDK